MSFRGAQHDEEAMEAASRKAEAFDPATAKDDRVFVIGELGVVVDPDRRLLVISVPKNIIWGKEAPSRPAAELVEAVADAMERRKDNG